MLGKMLAQRIEVWWPEEGDRRKRAAAELADELRSSARPAVAPFLRSPSFGHHTSIPCANIFPSTSSTFPNLQPAHSRPESPPPPPVTIGARLKLCSAVDPFLQSSSARTDRKNGFVVSYLCSLAFFPFRCAPPAPVNGRRRRACCCLSCDVKKTNRGRSTQGGRTVRKLG